MSLAVLVWLVGGHGKGKPIGALSSSFPCWDAGHSSLGHCGSGDGGIGDGGEVLVCIVACLDWRWRFYVLCILTDNIPSVPFSIPFI